MIDLFKEPIRTLGMNQPYASLMLHGKIETRWVQADKEPPFPKGLYMLYACKQSASMQSFKMISGRYCRAVWEALDKDQFVPDGAPIALARLTEKWMYNPGVDGPQTFVDSDGMMEMVQFGESKFFRLWCLKFEQVMPIKYFPFKGKQGIGFLTDDQKRQIVFA